MSGTNEPPSRVTTVAALIFSLVFVACAVWLAFALIAGVKQQNCVMSGRRDCLVVPAP